MERFACIACTHTSHSVAILTQVIGLRGAPPGTPIALKLEINSRLVERRRTIEAKVRKPSCTMHFTFAMMTRTNRAVQTMFELGRSPRCCSVCIMEVGLKVPTSKGVSIFIVLACGE